MFFSYDSHTHLHHGGSPTNIVGFIICNAVSIFCWGVDAFLLPWVEAHYGGVLQMLHINITFNNFSEWVSLFLNVLSIVSLIVGIILASISIQDKLRARKEKMAKK